MPDRLVLPPFDSVADAARVARAAATGAPVSTAEVEMLARVFLRLLRARVPKPLTEAQRAEIRARVGLDSDNAIAKSLGVARQTVRKIRREAGVVKAIHEQEERVVALLVERGPLSTSGVASALDWGRRVAARTLTRLEKRGRVLSHDATWTLRGDADDDS